MSLKKNKTKKSPIFEKRRNSTRVFSTDFKRSKVQKILKKELTVQQISDLYDVSRSSVYKWIYKYSTLEKGTKLVVQMESEGFKTQQLLEQVAELERIIGQKQLEIDYLTKTLEVASEEVGYDLKKKCAPESSNGLNPPKTK
ncbi:helix-turn-helix domain-containing protein [uncultured Microscilla sp.]|uniref:helix-turn-helix domain-containing protein n=2 Tax=uncultured Microscilla sp. TaxID=432653 RepID=UPI0026339278|nr:helix-turn-helix domain-containing protein [uncultured Microscilla sp.]